MTSCSDYLENPPYSFTTTDNFYTTPNEAELALTGVYNILSAASVQGFGNNATYSRNLMFMLNGATDEAFVKNQTINPDYKVWGDASFTAQSSFTGQAWVFLYAGINRANYLIEKIEDIEGFKENRKKEIIAEARVLRGFYHMILSMMYGGVPAYTSSIQDPFQARNSIQEVYNIILDDYKFAYETLPERASTNSHVNKWTAAGLLAKAHTYLASAKNSGLQGFIDINSFEWVNVDEHYDAALIYTTETINNSGYIVTENYDYLFRETTKEAQYEEFLFSAEASNDPTGNVVNVILNGFIPQGNANTVGGGYGWYRPTTELYNMYSDSDFRKNHNLTGNINNKNNPEDIDGIRYYAPRALPNTNVGYYCIGKYRMVDPIQKATANWASNINIPILRFADVLLLHAEALYFTGNETNARTTLTTIRERSLTSGSTISELEAAYSKPNFIEELLEERARELCFENWRRIDLARFNVYDNTIENLSETDGFYNKETVPVLKNNWKEERVWFPIPTIQIDLNKNLTQNQGY